MQPNQPAAAEGAPESAAPSEETLATAQAEGGVQNDADQLGSAAQQGDEGQGSSQQGEKGKKRDLSELLQPGDAVEFVVAASSQEGVRQHKGSRPPKMMGKEVSTALNIPALLWCAKQYNNLHPKEGHCTTNVTTAGGLLRLLQLPLMLRSLDKAAHYACGTSGVGACACATRGTFWHLMYPHSYKHLSAGCKNVNKRM